MHAYHGWPFLSAPDHPLLSAAWAFLVHGCLGLVPVLPIVAAGNRRALFAVLAFAGGVGLDVDHAVVAGSASPRAMEHLGHRPETHSLLLAALLGLATLALTRRKVLAWAVLAILLAHLLFDAAGGGVYWLFPLKHPDSIPWVAFPVGLGVLFGVSAAIARRREPSRRASSRGGESSRPVRPASFRRQPG